MNPEDQKWFRCNLCGYEWTIEHIDVVHIAWYDDVLIARCHECKDSADKLPKEDINAGFIPC